MQVSNSHDPNDQPQEQPVATFGDETLFGEHVFDDDDEQEGGK